MKTYEVEFRRTSYITYTVEAQDKDEAERKAWIDIPDHEFNSADWEVESIEETTGDQQ
jgi:hypothetical protein